MSFFILMGWSFVFPAGSFGFGSILSKKKGKSQMTANSFKVHFKVDKYKLKNGLTVLLYADKKAPLVNYQTWYRVGSRDDPPKQTGMAHLFEHMMFRGTKKREGKDFIKDVESRGISYNAYTSYDRTVYHFNLPESELDFVAELEAERMTELAVNDKNLKLEQEIVKEERLMRYKNNPQNMWIDIFENAFTKSFYRWPVIGYPQDIERVSVSDCQKFYDMYYAPNNAVLVVAGPIHVRKTKKIIEKYYGALPASQLANRSYPAEPPQKKVRQRDIYKKVQAPSLAAVYHTPKAGSPESYALEVLGYILSGGKAGRLYQLLVEKKEWSVSAQSMNFGLENSGLFIVMSALHPKSSLSAVEKAMENEVAQLTQGLVLEEELSRAKVNIMKSHIDSLKTAEGKAELLGFYETVFNDYTRLFDELEKYNAVTAQSALKVAQKYLNPYQQNLVRLYPK